MIVHTIQTMDLKWILNGSIGKYKYRKKDIGV